MTKEYTIGTETVLARLAIPDWKSSQASECGRVSGPVGVLESGGVSVLHDGGDAQGDGREHHQHHPADPYIEEDPGVE